MSSNEHNSDELLIDSEAATTTADEEPLTDDSSSGSESELNHTAWCEVGEHFVAPDDMWPDFADCQGCASGKELLVDPEAAATAADEEPLVDWWFAIDNVVHLVESRIDGNSPTDECFCSKREAWLADFEAMCGAMFGDENPLRHASLE